MQDTSSIEENLSSGKFRPFCLDINNLNERPEAPLLTWLNFNPSMDKEPHTQESVG